jgi:hypothetical protein
MKRVIGAATQAIFNSTSWTGRKYDGNWQAAAQNNRGPDQSPGGSGSVPIPPQTPVPIIPITPDYPEKRTDPGALMDEENIHTGELTGFRYWNIFFDTILCSLNGSYVWVPGTFKADVTPATHNSHGVYSYKEKTNLPPNMGADAVYIPGQIDIWGEVILHERGYRSEYARITELFSSSRISKQTFDRLNYLYLGVGDVKCLDNLSLAKKKIIKILQHSDKDLFKKYVETILEKFICRVAGDWIMLGGQIYRLDRIRWIFKETYSTSYIFFDSSGNISLHRPASAAPTPCLKFPGLDELSIPTIKVMIKTDSPNTADRPLIFYDPNEDGLNAFMDAIDGNSHYDFRNSLRS